MLSLAETDAELGRLAILHKNHCDEQYLARRNTRDLPEEIRRLETRLGHLTTDMATAEAHRGDDLIVGDRPVLEEDAMAALGKRLDYLPEKVERMRRFPLGKARGLEFGLIMHHLGGTEAYLEGAATRRTALLKDNPGPRAVMNAVERLLGRAGAECDDYREDIKLKGGQLADYEARIGTPLPHEDYASQSADLRDALELGLAEKPPEGGTPTAELAERIRVLRESVTVEAAPERTGARQAVRAERPVTARIRERMRGQAVAEAEPVAEVVAVPELVVEPVAEVIPLPTKPVEEKPEDGKPGTPPDGVSGVVIPAMYQERGYAGRVTRRRQDDGAQLTLF